MTPAVSTTDQSPMKATPQADSAPVETAGVSIHTKGAQSRLDPLRDVWTIFAPGRDDRPHEFVESKVTTKSNLSCPFCKGNEDQTPLPVWAGKINGTQKSSFQIDRSPSANGSALEKDWSVRVVPNKFPAVGQVGAPSPDSSGNATSLTGGQVSSNASGLFQCSPVVGGHEVVIESKAHGRSLTDRSVTEAELVFRAYRDRLDHYRSTPEVRYATVFKNVGKQAGASLAHSHSQIIATNAIPRAIQLSFHRMKRHRAKTGCCLMCDLVREERRMKDRVITRDDHAIAYCPFASHLPMLVRVTTIQHHACYEDLSDQAIRSVSGMVYRVLSWLEQLRPGTDYNYCLSTKPSGITDSSDAFHWSLDLFPRMTQIAGFEWASGCMINPVLPETAAKAYRYRAIASDPRLTL